MGAAASFPDEVTQDEAIKLAGDKWDEKLRALWPEGAEKVTKEQLIAIIKDIPIFAQRNPGETGDVSAAAASAPLRPAPPPAPRAPSGTPWNLSC